MQTGNRNYGAENEMSTNKSLRMRILGAIAVAAIAWTAAVPGNSAGAAKDAPLSIAPGQTLTVTQDVQAPFVPPEPDIVLLVDRTGSMGPAITNVKSKIAGVIAAVRASEPEARFAIAAYCDTGEQVPSYQTVAPMSGDAASVIDAMIAMPLCYGGDLPEAQLDALYRIGGWGKQISFRPGSQRIVAWFGDAPGHTRLRSEHAAIASLKAARAQVVAVSVGKNQLDSTGQASRITKATGGTLVSGVSPDRVANAILEGITSLPVKVEAKADCGPGASITFADDALTIARGTTATFTETVTLAADAVIGDSLGCKVHFIMDGVDLGADYTQSLNILVVPPVDNPDGTPTPPIDQPSTPAEPEPTLSTPAPEQPSTDPSTPAGGQSQDPSPAANPSPSADPQANQTNPANQTNQGNPQNQGNQGNSAAAGATSAPAAG